MSKPNREINKWNVTKIKKLIFSTAIIALMFSFIFFTISGLNIAFEEKQLVDEFFESENIVKMKEIIPTRDGSHIATHIYMNKSLINSEDRSLPTIIFIAGANNGKTHRIEQKIHLLRQGFAIVAMDQRGHHESGGYFGFYEKEPYDVSDVIDFLQSNYLQLNTTHIGIIGMSLGGGAALAAQAIDNRIHVSAIYHPLSNMTDYFEAIGVDLVKLIGYGPGITYESNSFKIPDWDEELYKTWVNRSTINLVTPENTKNLLLLHGTEDGEVRPINSERIVDKVNPLGTREDVYLILREGLGHGENEKDEISLKYVIAWCSYHFGNTSIDISNLDVAIENIHLEELIYPSTGKYEQYFTYATVILAILLFLSFIIYELVLKSPTTNNTDEKADEILPTKIDRFVKSELNEKKLVVNRSILLVLSFLLSALYCRMFNPSIVYGGLIYSGIIAIPLLLLFDKNIAETKKEFKILFRKETIINFTVKIVIFLGPLFLYFLILNYAADLTNNDVKLPEITIAIRYILIFSVPFIIPMVYMRNVSIKNLIFFLISVFTSLLLFLLIIPLPQIEIIQIPALDVILALVIALLFTIIFIIEYIIDSLFFRNKLILTLMIGYIISMLLWFRMMRLL